MAFIPVFQQFTKTVNAKTVAATLIGTPTANFVVTNVQFLLKTVSGLVVLPTMSVGITDPLYVDIVAAAILTNIATANQICNGVVIPLNSYVPSGTGIYTAVSVGATSTTITVQVIVSGYKLVNN